jgi:hypothetical protein
MNLLNKFGVPVDIQTEFVLLEDNQLFSSIIWNEKMLNPQKVQIALQDYGEDSFWEEAKEAFSVEDPEQALSVLQRGLENRSLKYLVSALKRSVSILKQEIKKKAEDVLN